MTASLLAVMMGFFMAPAAAQRVSVADRVTLLEQRAIEASTAANTANIEILNQITALRTELRELRGQVETLQQQNTAFTARVRSTFADLDERLQTLEQAATPETVMDEPGHAGTVAEPETPTAPADAPALPDAAHAPDAAELAPDPALERARYEAAFETLKSGRYSESVRLFQRFLQDFPDASYAANARYWLGESYYVMEDYVNAQRQFEALLRHFPEHDKTPGALLKIGLSQYGQRQYDAAEATLTQVEQRYPGTDAAMIATDRLRTMRISRLN